METKAKQFRVYYDHSGLTRIVTLTDDLCPREDHVGKNRMLLQEGVPLCESVLPPLEPIEEANNG